MIALSLVPGLGPSRVRKLVAELGSATAVTATTAQTLAAFPGIGANLADRIAAAPADDVVEAQVRHSERLGAEMLTLWDDEYPEMLRHIPVPPVFLWCLGVRPWLDSPCAAVVGTRTPTDYGRLATVTLVHDLVSLGFCVVSGLAVGIDAIAHRECIRCSGSTVAVFGSGLDVVYPARHRQLAKAIARRGALLSEFAMGGKPEAGNFPRRNRIIAGLCRAIVVVEARITGGAMVTARLGLDQNRDVFAVPGRIDSSASSGCHALIRRGEATLATSADDVARTLGMVDPTAVIPADVPFDSVVEERLWRGLGNEIKHVDELCVHTGLDVSVVLPILLRWEFSGAVYKLPGSRYRRCRRR